MLLNYLKRLLPCLGILAFCSIAACDPFDESRAIQSVKEAIIKETGNPLFLRIVRCEDLEDDLFNCQVHIKGKISKYAYIYRAYASGVDNTADQVVLHGLGDFREWYVAVARQTGEIYGLYGFDKASDSFNTMALDAQIQINYETTADAYHKLYIQCVLQNNYGVYVGSRSDLKGRVDSSFCNHIEEKSVKNCENIFDKWWKGFLKLGIAPRDLVTRQGDKYLITYFTLIETDDQIPLLRKVIYSISEKGLIGPVTIKPLYPESAFNRPQRMVG